MRDPRREEAAPFSSLARWPAKRTSAKRRKMRPRMGPEYSWALSPELARNWSAASQRRFSRVLLAVSFSEVAIHFVRVGSISRCDHVIQDRRRAGANLRRTAFRRGPDQTTTQKGGIRVEAAKVSRMSL